MNHDTGSTRETVDRMRQGERVQGMAATRTGVGNTVRRHEVQIYVFLGRRKSGLEEETRKQQRKSVNSARAPRGRAVHREGFCQGLTVSISELGVGVGGERCL